MKKYLLQFSISTLFTISAQSSPFKSFDIVIYPEYYFNGVMAEVEAEIFEGNLPLNLKFQVPTNTDSVFYVSGDSESPSIDETDFSIKGDIAHIDKIITDKKFRIFIFYGLEKNGIRRSGGFDFYVNHSIDDAHIVVQEPLVSSNFIFSEKIHEDFKDQHGINFKRIHVNNYTSNTTKSITFTYDNPSQDISINSLQKGVQSTQNTTTAQNTTTLQNTGPIRHTLPLWQPLVTLSFISIVVGGMFYRQMKSETKSSEPKPRGKFCTECGSKIGPKDKFCSNCGAKI